MARRIGQHVTAKELEQHPGGPEWFTRLCNALVWACTPPELRKTLPVFTERINAPDGGIDAEWVIEVPSEKTIHAPFVQKGWNVFQYKWRDPFARDVTALVRTLCTNKELKGALKKIYDKNRRIPGNYVLFTNLDLDPKRQKKLQNAILEGCEPSDKIQVEIAHAGLLAPLVNNWPPIRSAFFEEPFTSWEEANKHHESSRIYGKQVELIGRDEQRNQIRAFLKDPSSKVFVLTGSHQMGKTRLALEAARDPERDDFPFMPTAVLQDPFSVKPSELKYLAGPKEDVLVIVDDPTKEKIQSFIDHALATDHLKLLFTVPLPPKASVPFYSRDPRVGQLPLEELPPDQAEKILESRGVGDWGLRSWIVEKAGGNPGILLMAAGEGEKLREAGDNFIQEIAKAFKDKMEINLGENAVSAARILSVCSRVRSKEDDQEELREICNLFGNEFDDQKVPDQIENLETAGYLRRTGPFVEVLPPLLAGFLAGELLSNRPIDVFLRLIITKAQPRFFQRLAHINPERIRSFWDAIFGRNGPFQNLGKIKDNARVLNIISPTVPDRVMQLLKAHLPDTSIKQRKAIAGNPRRNLVWTLEELMFRESTSATAVGLMLLLAEAENEKCGNNAEGMFRGFFWAYHPQVPIGLNERIALLEGFTRPGVPSSRQLLAIDAMGVALDSRRTVMLHGSYGPKPLEGRPSMTSADISDYAAEIVNLLLKIAKRKGEPDIAEQAVKILPGVARLCAYEGCPADAMPAFEQLIKWAEEENKNVDIAVLSSDMNKIAEFWKTHLEKRKLSQEKHKELESLLVKLNDLQSDIPRGFFFHLKRWAGEWTGFEFDRIELEVKKLAEEACQSPELLEGSPLEWLISEQAKKNAYFFDVLGTIDEKGIWKDTLTEFACGEHFNLFTSYISGWARRDNHSPNLYLMHLFKTNIISPKVFVITAVRLIPKKKLFQQIIDITEKGLVEPDFIGQNISLGSASLWYQLLSDKDFLQLLRLITRKDIELTSLAIELIHLRIRGKDPFPAYFSDFAWQCLEAECCIQRLDDSWHRDELASKLTEAAPEKGFQFAKRCLNKLSMKNWDRVWRFIGHHGRGKFWKLLLGKDTERTLRMVLEFTTKDPDKRNLMQFDLRGCIDQEEHEDLLTKLAGENTDNAKVIGDCLTSAQSGFWKIATQIADRWSNEPDVLSSLTAAMMQNNQARWGSEQVFHEKLRKDIGEELKNSKTPAGAKQWMRRLLVDLGDADARAAAWEYDVNYDDLMGYVRDRNSSMHLWAIRRILNYWPWEKASQYLTVKNIEEALEKLDMPEKKRKALASAVEVWNRES